MVIDELEAESTFHDNKSLLLCFFGSQSLNLRALAQKLSEMFLEDGVLSIV